MLPRDHPLIFKAHRALDDFTARANAVVRRNARCCSQSRDAIADSKALLRQLAAAEKDERALFGSAYGFAALLERDLEPSVTQRLGDVWSGEGAGEAEDAVIAVG
jgi:hypothetical protein